MEWNDSLALIESCSPVRISDSMARRLEEISLDGNVETSDRYVHNVKEVIREGVLRLFPNLGLSRSHPCYLDLVVSVLMTALAKVLVLDRAHWPSLADEVIDFTVGGFAGLLRDDSVSWNREKTRSLRKVTQTRRLITRDPEPLTP